jgi:hypothetical protein
MDIIKGTAVMTTQNSCTFSILNNQVRKGQNVLVLLYSCTLHMYSPMKAQMDSEVEEQLLMLQKSTGPSEREKGGKNFLLKV